MKTTLSIIRNLSARTLAFSGIVATTLSTFATPASASVLNNRVFQLEVAKRGPNGETLCLAVDISKIGVLPAANRAKVEPCRNIAEQQFRTVSVDNTYFRIQTAHAAPDGQAKCLDTNVTKIGVVAGANQSYFGNCANIQEQLYSKFRHDYANPVRQLLKVGTTSPHYCLDIDGSKYGVLPAAQFAKFGGCARVDEQWITFRSLSALTPVPTGWRHLLLGTGHALNTNFGSRFHNAQFNRPAVGLWQAISGDPDQFFRFEPQLNGSYLVRNNKTGLCMDSTANPQAGSKVIVHDCNPGNTNQFWDPLPQGNNVYLLQRSGTNLCLDSTGQNVDGTHTHLWPCDGGNGNQRFASAYVAPPAPPAPPVPTAPISYSQASYLANKTDPSADDVNKLTLIRTGAAGKAALDAVVDSTTGPASEGNDLEYADHEQPFLRIDGWMISWWEGGGNRRTPEQVQQKLNEYCRGKYDFYAHFGDLPPNAWHVWGHYRNAECVYNGEKPRRHHFNFYGPVNNWTVPFNTLWNLIQ